MKLKIYLSLLLFSFLSGMVSQGAEHPKREFRGAWIHTVGQSRYMEMNRDAIQDYFDQMLDSLQHIGINAVIFQVRLTADALYRSELEPWSKYLTGKQGVAPEPLWDPLQYMIEQCHARNMELHAWLNPYRVGTNADEPLAASHIYHKHPEWFVRYGRQLYFDPGLPECRRFIGRVVDDIVSRYDVDAIHMDDYFYPYPIAGSEFPDENSYARYGNGMDRGDWRRENVNALIKELHKIIKSRKPWVRFGISPFGIYRNQKERPGRQCDERVAKLRPALCRCVAVDTQRLGRLHVTATLLGDRSSGRMCRDTDLLVEQSCQRTSSLHRSRRGTYDECYRRESHIHATEP